MRVLLVSNLYPPYWVGGYEQIAAWVAEGLGGRGHAVHVLTGRGAAFAGREDVSGRLDVDLAAFRERYFAGGPFPSNGLGAGLRRHVFSPANYAACRALLRERPVDLVSFWNPAFVSFAPLVAARREGVPAVVHLSDTTANVFRNPHPPTLPRPLRPLARLAVDWLLRLSRPRRVFVPSGFLREKLLRREALAAQRTQVLHWPVEPNVSRRPAPQRDRERATRLLFVGTLIPEKGVDRLVEAFRAAHERRPQLTLTLVGEGPAAYVARLGEAARGLPVVFRGRLERADVLAAYASHDVLAFPSVWDEPFAVVPLEAMAMGLAVVASAAGGTPEAVAHEQTGLLVPPRDVDALTAAILRLHDEPQLARRLARAGCEHARRQHGFDGFLDRLEALYASAAAEARA